MYATNRFAKLPIQDHCDMVDPCKMSLTVRTQMLEHGH
jgi:hypothetical protein